MDYKAIIREEMEYQQRRLYKRLRTGDGKLIVEYWQGSKNFLNAIHGISWEKQGNKILIKEKATEMKSFRDILLLEKSARTGTTTQKDRTGHIHSVILDDDGTGKTVGTKGGDDHVHKVVEYSVQPSGGHTHKLADKLNETDPRIKMKLTKLEPGDLFKKLKQNKITIRQLSDHMGVTLKRIREVNNNGLKGNAAFDYVEAIDTLADKL